MFQQRRQGHDVYLLTLTRGGATKQRLRLGLSIEQMGQVRFEEMQAVAQVLDLAGLFVKDLPDGRLKEEDPIAIENVVRQIVDRIRPTVIVTYPAHGISGFEDHLVTHAVVKRLFCELQARGSSYPRRLAFTTLETVPEGDRPLTLRTSTEDDIDCRMPVTEEGRDAQVRALNCYETYQEMIEKMRPAELLGKELVFEIYQEKHDPPLDDLLADL